MSKQTICDVCRVNMPSNHTTQKPLLEALRAVSGMGIPDPEDVCPTCEGILRDSIKKAVERCRVLPPREPLPRDPSFNAP